MDGFDSWESYFYPHPNAGTLRNIPGILDPNELTQFEYTAVAARQRLLAMNPEAWNNAAEFSRPDRGSYDVVPDMLVPVFRHLAILRD